MFIFFRALKSGMEAIHLLFSNELATHLPNKCSRTQVRKKGNLSVRILIYLV